VEHSLGASKDAQKLEDAFQDAEEAAAKAVEAAEEPAKAANEAVSFCSAALRALKAAEEKEYDALKAARASLKALKAAEQNGDAEQKEDAAAAHLAAVKAAEKATEQKDAARAAFEAADQDYTAKAALRAAALRAAKAALRAAEEAEAEKLVSANMAAVVVSKPHERVIGLHEFGILFGRITVRAMLFERTSNGTIFPVDVTCYATFGTELVVPASKGGEKTIALDRPHVVSITFRYFDIKEVTIPVSPYKGSIIDGLLTLKEVWDEYKNGWRECSCKFNRYAGIIRFDTTKKDIEDRWKVTAALEEGGDRLVQNW
jgi:hypothetical protein